MVEEKKLTQVFCAAIYSTEPLRIGNEVKQGSWSEPYGYMGSYYKSYPAARQEIAWLMHTYPRYTEWYIERRFLDENNFMVSTDRDCVIGQSRNALIC